MSDERRDNWRYAAIVSLPSQVARDFMTQNFIVGDCVAAPTLNRLTRAGKTIQVEPKVMAVLVCLAAHAPDVVGKQELLNEAWRDTFVSDHVLSHVIWQLRKALGSSDLIETVPRRGYRLTAEAVLEASRTHGVVSGATQDRSGARRWLLSAVALLALFFGVGALWWNSHHPALRQPVRRLALLPLEPAITGPSQQLLVAGINHDLKEQFLELHALQVLGSRTTASLFAGGSRKSWSDLARENRADAVLHGTAAVHEDQVRITLELWDARAHQVVLAESFEQPLRDSHNLYAHVVRQVAEAGKIAIADGEALRLGGPPLNPEGYREYLRGVGLYGTGQSLQHYRRAVALNPEFAPAYVSAAAALRDKAAFGDIADIAQREEARAMARRGLELDPKSAPALAVLASIEANLFWNWKEAGKRFEEAEKLRPDHPLVVGAYFPYLAYTGQCEKAMEVVRRGEATDLSSSWPLYGAHWTHYMCGQFETAINEAQAALARDPSAQWAHHHSAYAYSALSRHRQAIAECEKAANEGRCEEPYLLARAGRLPEARAALRKWQSESFPPFFIALAYLGLGDRNSALLWLAQGYKTRDPNMRFILDPVFNPLRGDVRFRELAGKMDLPPGVYTHYLALAASR